MVGWAYLLGWEKNKTKCSFFEMYNILHYILYEIDSYLVVIVACCLEVQEFN